MVKDNNCVDVEPAFEVDEAEYNDTVILPFGRFDRLSRGKGWARLGSADFVQWADKTSEGWEVSEPGTWIVGSSDGFRRSERVEYQVIRTEDGLAIRSVNKIK